MYIMICIYTQLYTCIYILNITHNHIRLARKKDHARGISQVGVFACVCVFFFLRGDATSLGILKGFQCAEAGVSN